ncbi:MAG TPA: MerR family transcriptional regulator [Sporichthyaceae bacterium]|jgi:DNA-binding transcriptional MerR regulator|nr:MerR family transcriptional regulator [Sporichthyaceae bacterium]
MEGLTITEAAATTGWSARMLRYIESLDLVAPTRSRGGYRIYGPESLQRLRTLRALLAEHELGLGDVGLALRLRRDPELCRAVDEWLDSRAQRPAEVDSVDWLCWEQDKHQALLARTAAGRS